MPGQMVHVEFPADDTEAARELLGRPVRLAVRGLSRQPLRVPHGPDQRRLGSGDLERGAR